MSVIAVLTGIVGLIGAALPVYFTWRKWYNEKNRKVNIAADNPRRHDFFDRMRKRLPQNKHGEKGDAE